LPQPQDQAVPARFFRSAAREQPPSSTAAAHNGAAMSACAQPKACAGAASLRDVQTRRTPGRDGPGTGSCDAARTTRQQRGRRSRPRDGRTPCGASHYEQSKAPSAPASTKSANKSRPVVPASRARPPLGQGAGVHQLEGSRKPSRGEDREERRAPPIAALAGPERGPHLGWTDPARSTMHHKPATR
jgi:hypothetical protein